MIDRSSDVHGLTRAAGILPLLALACGLGGCAGVGDSFASSAFVDPAKYDMFDCKQLEAERKGMTARTAELQGLIDKAQTGTGGAVVSELVYRNDYISTRASLKLVEENWRKSKCVATTPVVATPTSAVPRAVAPAAIQSKSGSAVY